LPPQKPQTGRPAEDHRRIINGILWVNRTGPNSISAPRARANRWPCYSRPGSGMKRRSSPR